MAKKEMCGGCEPVEYKPSLYLDLEDSAIKLLKEVTVGETARFVVTGVVRSISKSEYKGEKARGSISVEDYKISAVGANKDLEDLLDD